MEMSKNELPDGWKFVKMSKLIDDNLSGFACAISKHVDQGGYVHLRPFNVEDGKLNLNTLYQVPLDEVDTEVYTLKKGDILFNNTNSTELVGKSALIDGDYQFAFSNHINRIRVKKSMASPEYFHYYLLYMWSKGHFERNCKKWIGQSGYTVKELSEQGILLPPLAEQIRIALKLDRQMVQIEMMKKEAESYKEDAKNLFNAYLKEIFSSNLFNQYQKIKLMDLTTKIGSGLTPNGGHSVYQNMGIPFIRSMNVHLNRFKSDGLVYISPEIDESMKNTRVQKGDVLLNITGASIGRVCVVPDEIYPANVNQHVSIIRTTEKLNSYYLSYYLSNPNFQKFIMDSESGATRQALTKLQIQNFGIPIPPIEIQEQLVYQLDKKRKSIRELLDHTNIQLEAINRFPNSILNEIFGKYEIPDEA
ncbi:MAG: putative Type restriction modification specificity domain protein [Euryarchaeota archaeon]|nr:putative Type restriction modification specificity domain protein [Euryarchaeota archaeon]